MQAHAYVMNVFAWIWSEKKKKIRDVYESTKTQIEKQNRS